MRVDDSTSGLIKNAQDDGQALDGLILEVAVDAQVFPAR
jgi:hypothetical protein